MCKKCTKCNTEYSTNVEEHFHKKHNTKDGLNNICRYCCLENRHKVPHVNEDGSILCTRCLIYKENDEFDINDKKWYRKNKDNRCKVCKKKQYHKRRIQNRGDNGIERLLTERYCALRDRAKTKGMIVGFERGYLKELWELQNGICAISGIEMTTVVFNGRVPTNISVDRKDSNIGYTKENVQLVCMAVNQMKNDLSQEELIFFCNKIVEHEKENSNR
jgi:hypothetical protein